LCTEVLLTQEAYGLTSETVMTMYYTRHSINETK
jgi:hypothetical protein